MGITALFGKLAKSSDKEPFAAGQGGKAAQPKKLAWRIAALAVIGLLSILLVPSSIIGFIIAAENGFKQMDFAVFFVFLTLVLCLSLVFIIVNLKNALKWNKTIQAAQSSGQAKQPEGS
jgi:hypothetical protein